jgi:hypothetical protein
MSTGALAADIKPTITIRGVGNVITVPDTAFIRLGVSNRAGSAGEAVRANSRNMGQVIAMLKDAGLTDKQLQTSNFSVFPRYADRSGSTQSQALTVIGYEVNSSLTVRLNDPDRIGKILDQIVAAGGNRIDNVWFTRRATSALLDQARTKAVRNARSRATSFADAANMRLGRLISIVEDGAQLPQPAGRQVQRMAMAESVPIAPGEQTISASVTIVWQLLPM